MEGTKSTVAKNIVRLRQASGMTQAELAAKLNYSDKAVSKWERGESMPDVAVLSKIADLFQVSLDWLVRGEVMSAEPAVKERRWQCDQYSGLYLCGACQLDRVAGI